jgi:chemotaxis protein methyltransferase CheR
VIFCRNVLIYFNSALQDRVQNLFLESLEMFGVLGLGRKETIRYTAVAENYDVIDQEEKLYRRVR